MHITPQEVLDRAFPPAASRFEDNAEQYVRTGSWWIENMAPGDLAPTVPDYPIPGYPYPFL